MIRERLPKMRNPLGGDIRIHIIPGDGNYSSKYGSWHNKVDLTKKTLELKNFHLIDKQDIPIKNSEISVQYNKDTNVIEWTLSKEFISEINTNATLKDYIFRIQMELPVDDENWEKRKDNGQTVFFKNYKNTVEIMSGDKILGTDVQTQEFIKDPNANILKKSFQVTGDVVKYSVIVNPEGRDLLEDSETLTFFDTLQFDCNRMDNSNMSLIKESFQIFDYSDNRKGACIGKIPYGYNEKRQIFDYHYIRGTNTITAEIPDSRPLLVEYEYMVSGKKEKNCNNINNSVIIKGIYTKNTETSKIDKVVMQHSAAEAAVKGMIFEKCDAANNEKMLSGAKFDIYKYNKNTFEKITSKTTDGKGKFVFNKEDQNYEENVLYKMVEVSAPESYVLDTTPFYFAVVSEEKDTIRKPDDIRDFETFVGGGKKSFVNEKNTAVIKVKKRWQNEKGQEIIHMGSIKIDLYKKRILKGSDDDEESLKNCESVKVGTYDLKATENWYKQITRDQDGHILRREETINGEIFENRYFISEHAVEGYETSVSSLDDSGEEKPLGQEGVSDGKIILVNTKKTVIPVKKIWVGPKEKQVIVELLKDNKSTGHELVLSDKNGWEGVFEQVDSDNLKDYQVVEKISKKYASAITGNAKDGFVITNTYKWPVKFNKFDFETKTNTQLNGARLCVRGTNSQTYHVIPGQILELLPGTYTLSEESVPENYEKAESIHFTVGKDGTVSYTGKTPFAQRVSALLSSDKEVEAVKHITMYDMPKKKNITIVKEWRDNKNQDGIRPESVTVNLLADGKQTKTCILNAENNWQHVFKNLPTVKDGRKIEYAVTENQVKSYQVESIKTSKGFKIVNSYSPKKRSVTVAKEWRDLDNQDGIRPESITVQLYANKEKAGDTVTLKRDNWIYTWQDLPIRKGGKLITYSVKEVGMLTGYSLKQIAGDMEKGFHIINEHVPEKINIQGQKTWKNDDGKGFEVKFKLYADDQYVGETSGTDTYKFESLDKYKSGKAINYRVEEIVPEGYKSEKKGFDFTNTQVGKRDISIQKVWKNPEYITHDQDTAEVKLYANEKEIEKTVLSKDNSWKHTFTGLEKYDEQGKKISYKVGETLVSGYSSQVTGNVEEGFIITNTITGSMNIPVRKTWNDDLTEHKEIQISIFDVTNASEDNVWDKPVMRDGEEYTVLLNSENQWMGEFTNLPKYDCDGNKKVYGIHEEPLAGYWEPQYHVTAIQGQAGMEIVNTINGYLTFKLRKNWEGPKKEAVIKLHGVSGPESNGKYDVDFTIDYKLNAENGYSVDAWVYKYDYLGREIHYTLDEGKMKNYVLKDITSQKGAELEEDHVRLIDQDIVTFTNKNIEKVHVPVEKIWNDNKKEHVPVTVYLIKAGREKNDESRYVLNDEGQKVQVTLTDENLKGEFKNLPKYEADGTEIDYRVEEGKVAGYNSSVTGNMQNGYKIKNTEELTIGVTKKWIGKAAIDKVKIGVYFKGTDVIAKDKLQHKMIAELSKDNGMSHTFVLSETNPKDIEKYEIREITTPKKGENWKFDSVKYEGGTAIVTNKNTKTTSLKVKKVWKDPKGTQHEKVRVQLLRDSRNVTGNAGKKVLEEKNNWTGTFENLPVYDDKDGHEITYSVKEENVSNHYIATVVKNKDECIITNTMTGKREITVHKKWIGPVADSIEVFLLKNNQPVKTADGQDMKVLLSAHNKWTAKFPEVDRYDANGQKIVYTIKEVLPENIKNQYEKSYSEEGDTFTITNRNTDKISIPVEKIWNGKARKAQFELYADGKKAGRDAIELGEGKQKGSFKNLPCYSAEGKKIHYTVKEIPVKGYRSNVKVVDGKYIFTNTELQNIKVKKIWNMPEKIAKTQEAEFELISDSQKTGKILKIKGNNEAEFKNLPVNTPDGRTIVYDVREIGNKEFEIEKSGNSKNGYTFTNTLLCPVRFNKFETAETSHLHGVEMALYEGGFTENQTPYIENIHPGELYMIPKGDYTLVETKCPEGYEKADNIKFSISGKGIVIKNTFKINKEGTVFSETMETGKAYRLNKEKAPQTGTYKMKRATVKRITERTKYNRWSQEQGSDEWKNRMQRKSLIHVLQLGYPNNLGFLQQIYGLTDKEFKTVTQDAIWYYTSKFDVDRESYTFGMKDVFKELTSIPDDVEEKLNMYLYESDDMAYIGTQLLETRTLNMFDKPAEIVVKGKKIWNDNNDQDGIRPENITVTLLADGKNVESKVIKETDQDWKFEFHVPGYKNGKKIKYTVLENAVKNYSSTVTEVCEENFEIVNSYTPKKTDVNVVKAWNDNDNQDGIRPESVTVKLLADGEETGKSLTLNEANGWSDAFKELDVCKEEKEILYTIQEVPVAGYECPIISGDAVTGFKIINTHKPEAVEYVFQKIWDDKNNQDGLRPDILHVRLTDVTDKAHPVIIQREILTDKKSDGSFTNIPVYRDGKKIIYQLEENYVEGYVSTCEIISQNSRNSYTFINTHTPEKLELSGEKIWKDNNDQDGIRPESVTVNLLADGEKIVSQTVTKANGWTYTFKDLDKFRDGKEIAYTLTEEEVPGYVSETKGWDVINTHQTVKRDVSGKKIWKDKKDQDNIRPESITVNLLADGKKIASQTVTKANGWTYTFKDLEKFCDGKEIAYTLTEEEVPGYVSEMKGWDVINTHQTVKRDVSGKKIWKDKNNQDKIRPESVTVNLLADGEKIASQTVTEADRWTYTFKDLDKFRDGKEITYTITEDPVYNYIFKRGNNNDIENLYTPGKTSITVSKHWNDNNDQDKIRPKEIAVQLYANKEKQGDPVILSEKNNWIYTFIDLDVKNNGKNVVYTVKEEKVPKGYEVEIKDFVITNTHYPEKCDVDISKIWKGKEADSITVYLLANGKQVDRITLTKKDKWIYKFKNLPRYKEGKVIVYTIAEETIKGYQTEIKGDMETGFRITNTEEKQKKTGKKDQNKHFKKVIMRDKGVPQTGDTSKPFMYGLTIILAIVGFCFGKKKKR